MSHSLLYILEVLGPLVTFFFVARFLLQAARADFYNPISQGIVKITDPVLKPLRSIAPSFGRIDSASLLGAWILQALFTYASFSIRGDYYPGTLTLLVGSLFAVVHLIITVYWALIIVSIVASFVAPGSQHPALTLAQQIIEPVMGPARRLIPPIGGLDFSPILVLLALGLLRSSVIPQLQMGLLGAL
jgi:YggT family protein